MAQTSGMSDIPFKTELAAAELKLMEKLSQLEGRILKMERKLILWMFVFWATQLAAMFAFLKFFIH